MQPLLDEVVPSLAVPNALAISAPLLGDEVPLLALVVSFFALTLPANVLLLDGASVVKLPES